MKSDNIYIILNKIFKWDVYIVYEVRFIEPI
jgi:hypothetical protein